MPFIEPMLAAPMLEQLDFEPESYCAEEKYDGFRLLVSVGGPGQGDFFSGGKPVRAWTREGLSYQLPGHIIEEAGKLPDMTLDTELFIPGERSYGVARIENASRLTLTAFDILSANGESLVKDESYDERRMLLTEIFTHRVFKDSKIITLAASTPIQSYEHAKEICKDVWERDGEGLILKRRASLYLPGKRRKLDWIKMKQLQSTVMTITGFEFGKRGPHSRVSVTDDEGNTTAVKTKTEAILALIDSNPQSFLDRRIRIEFQERTPDKSYRHPRWDRLLEIGEEE